jgi:hypothetical protein
MKKVIQNISSVVALVLTFSIFQGCEIDDFKDINVSPNATTVPITSALLSNALVSLTDNYTFHGLYAQYWSESQYTDNSRYTATEYSFGGYSGFIYDLENIILNNTDPATKDKVAVNGSNNNQIAVARILKVFYFMEVTDVLGDVPYSQALKGEPRPVYDTQQSIYNSFFSELDAAVKQFDNGSPAAGDILFNGNITKWKKFANSLRALLALRLSKVDPNTGKTQFAAALASNGGVIESNSDNVTLNWAGGAYQNNWFSTYNGRKDYAISETVVSTLGGLNDPRVRAFGQPDAAGKVVGIPYGLPREQTIAFTAANPNWSFVLASDFRKDNSPQFIITAAHIFLARAEAAALSWTNESVSSMYNSGIKASMEQWKVFSQAAYDSYIAQPSVMISGNDLGKIRTQAWIAFFPNGLEGWNLWRRTGTPALQPSPFPVNSSKQIPRRFLYNSQEPNLNPENYNAAVSRLTGGDTIDGRVWWDK